MRDKITILWGDITQLAVDVIVNAANSHLAGGEGVDGAIHWAAGSGLDEECAAIGWCETGDAVVTGAYNLQARHIFHAVGPVWRGGEQGEEEQLARCYRRCFELAAQYGAKTIAFPAISGGVYRFPLERGSMIALEEARVALAANPVLETVYFVVYSAMAREIYYRSLETLWPKE